MTAHALLAFFLTLYLRKKVRTIAPDSPWNTVLTTALFAVIALFVADVMLDSPAIIRWAWNVLLLLIIGVIYKEKLFSFARSIMLAVVPVLFVLLLKDIVALFDTDWSATIETYLNYADSIAFTWMAAMLIVSNRQQKALVKEQKKREAEEAQNKIIAARRAELEALVLERTAELTQQKEELQHALTDLKATQAQLVHREKMASLGELTAGIAHEIQNPLNFINNFSELNVELSNELNQEIENLQVPAAAKQQLAEILTDLRQNEKKINDHGRRADSIVKGMLLHSRKTTGTKELTDINALADEYLRLSYHGLRAKDKTFNATINTDFDPAAEKINAVPQDLGRVFLNLFNNAFYAVDEKMKKVGGTFKPTVAVSTKRLQDKIEICVRDNGMGISKSVQDKIFQPFFTTKPTGEGTGLGLSLSYDIITKVHAGSIKVESKEGEGTTFTIILPAFK